MTGQVHIYAPSPIEARLVRLDCPYCEKERFGLQTIYEWHGSHLTCLRCGDSWGEEGREERPFYRYWRRDAVAQTRQNAKRFKAKLSKVKIRWRDK